MKFSCKKNVKWEYNLKHEVLMLQVENMDLCLPSTSGRDLHQDHAQTFRLSCNFGWGARSRFVKQSLGGASWRLKISPQHSTLIAQASKAPLAFLEVPQHRKQRRRQSRLCQAEKVWSLICHRKSCDVVFKSFYRHRSS